MFRASSDHPQSVSPNKQMQNAGELLNTFKYEALENCRHREVRISCVCVCRTGPHNVDITALQNYVQMFVPGYKHHSIMLIRTSWYLQFLRAKNFNVFHKLFIYTCLMQDSKTMIWWRSKHVAELLNFMCKCILNIFAFVGVNY